MLKGKSVNIGKANGIAGEYIIADKIGITIGRIFVLDLSNDNKFCCLRIKFYKQGENVFEIIKEVLNLFLQYLFKQNGINKVSVVIDEEISTRPFSEIGFSLEGILNESVIEKNLHKDELIFGIDNKTYNNNQRINVLRLYSNDINLKVLTPEDANDMLQYYIKNRNYLKPFEPNREESFYTFEAQRQILMENYKQFLNGDGANFGIYAGTTFIGKIQISSIIYGVFKSAIVGYSIDENYQGRGYMKQALSLIEDYAFNEMELHRIEASTLVDNVRSQGVLIGCGFEKLGVNKEYLFINGKWRDHITFYKIKKN